MALDDLPPASSSGESRAAVSIVLTGSARLLDARMCDRQEPFAKGTWLCLVDRGDAHIAAEAVLRKLAVADGGLERDIPAMLAAVARNQLRWDTPGAVYVDGRYVWREDGEAPDAAPQEPLAVHAVVSMAGTGGPPEPGTLDSLQRLAARAHVVTPYSSMIALVENWQRDMLREAEKEKDRFERQDEETPGTARGGVPERTGGGVSLPGLGATAVPEPEEWALIIAASCILLRQMYRKRRDDASYCR